VLVEVILVVLAVLCVVGVYLWTRLAATGARVIDRQDGHLEQVFYGGVMSRYLLTSGTMVRLELFDWGVRVRGTPVSRWLVPTWEARYDELAIAELVALPASRLAVCFRLRGGGEPSMAFLSDRTTSILRALESRGVPVNRSVTRIRRIRELYPS